ncbi:hypothetical protein [Xanthomonas phage XPP9]|nr:hypothetical protein [Xanthomonas phage XPP9]
MIRLDEILPGAVAYFDPALLNPDGNRFRPGANTPMNKPYVCIDVDGDGGSVWLSISSSPGIGGRIELLREWRTGGSPRWRKGDCYITNVTSTIWRPNPTFIAASQNEHDLAKCGRPHVTPVGIAVIRNAIEQRRA